MFATIKSKVTAAGVGMLLVCGLTASAGLASAVSMNSALKAAQAAADLTRSHMHSDMMHDAVREDVLSAMLAKDPLMGSPISEAKESLNKDAAAFAKDVKTSEGLATDQGVKSALEALDAPIETYVASAHAAVDAAENNPASAAQAMPEFTRQFRFLEGAMEQASDKIEVARDAASDHARTLGEFSQWFMIAALVAAIAGSLMLIMASLRLLVKPLESLAGSMGRLAAGDTDSAIVGAGRPDEIGTMAKATESFRQAALAKIVLEAETARARLSAEEARKVAEAEVLSSERASVVASVGQGMTALVDGELTYRMPDDLPSEYAQLRSDFNAAMGQLEDTMTSVRASADGIDVGADEIASASDDLSRRTEQQAASLEETAAALDQITATVKKTASGAKQASSVVTATRGEAQRSGEVVAGAVAAMDGIEKSSSKITQIIGVIDEIAFQTNLLALNAGVEAARAGEAGRGFAVVASEVRALAQRSAEAAKEIKALISASSAQVEQGVSLVGETGKALQSIVVKVAEIDSLVSEIAASAQEQSTGLGEVNTAVNSMDQVVQQNAAMVEQATAAAHSLKAETHEMARLIERFRVSGGPTRTRAQARQTSSFAPAYTPQPSSERRAPDRPNLGGDLMTREPAPAPRAHPQPVTDHTPAAPSPARAMAQRVAVSFGAAAPDADGWEEF
ncbi:MAG: hypothetical protein JWP35_4476 [Caulobacter sp.]|nr:hypothetical protein [Caulobacter sp.]